MKRDIRLRNKVRMHSKHDRHRANPFIYQSYRKMLGTLKYSIKYSRYLVSQINIIPT